MGLHRTRFYSEVGSTEQRSVLREPEEDLLPYNT